MSGFTERLAGWAERPAAELDAAALALVADAKAAARLREHQNDPNVAALSIERTRDRLDRWGWLFLFAGLAYTTVNVQAFVAGGAPRWSLAWLVAWLVEPMVMGSMLVLLRGEQIANRHGEQSGGWVRCTRWIALLITYVMNTGQSYIAGNLGDVFKHSVPVILVFCLAEALVQQRLVLTTVVEKLGGFMASSQRRRPNLASLSDQGGPVSDLARETPAEVPNSEGEVPNSEGEAPNPLDELTGARTLKERCYEAFCELVAEGRALDDIRPSEVDKRAEVRPGTAKVSGRMAEFRTRWVAEQDKGVTDGDQEAAG